MGQPVSLPVAQLIAPASAIFNFGAQTYGMLSSPNMKTISDRHVAAFSPHPMAIGYFFAPQQLLQLYWLARFFRVSTKQDKEALRYAPFYTLGNLMIGSWMFAWNSEHLKLAQLFVTINSLAQLYFVYTMLPPSTSENRATRLTAQTFAGIGVLDLIHNGSVAFFENVPPNLATKILTAISFPLAALLSTPVMGACYAYDALGIYLGQRNYNVGGDAWTNLLLATASITAAAVVAKVGLNWMKNKRDLGTSGSGSERRALLDAEGN